MASLVFLISLRPLTNPIPEPAFDASSQAVLTYAKANQQPPSQLGLVDTLGLFGFLVFAANLAAGFRAASDRSNIPWVLVIAAATVFMVTVSSWPVGLPSLESALAIGAGMFIFSAAPLNPIWFYPYLLFYVRVGVTSVTLLRS